MGSKGKPIPWACVGSFKMDCWPLRRERGHKVAVGLFEECLAIIPVPGSLTTQQQQVGQFFYKLDSCRTSIPATMVITLFMCPLYEHWWLMREAVWHQLAKSFGLLDYKVLLPWWVLLSGHLHVCKDFLTSCRVPYSSFSDLVSHLLIFFLSGH